MALRTPAFLIGILAAESVLAHTVGPSQSLQATNCDLVSAFATITRLQEYFEDVRLNAEASFNRLYKKAEQLLLEIGGPEEGIQMPRVCNRQAYRSNIAAETAEVYYRRSVFIPFIEQVIAELKFRFSENVPHALGIQEVLKGVNADTDAIMKAAHTYEGDLDAPAIFNAELKRWMKEVAAGKLPTLSEAADYAKKHMFQNMATLIRILLTLPVTNASAERSFSALKRLKTYLRNTMGSARLTGLALLAVHPEVDVDVNEVIDVFGQKNRRLLFT